MDGAQHIFTATPSTTCTFTLSLSGTAGYSFAGNLTTATHSVGTSGTETYSFTVYRMYYNTFELSAEGGNNFATGMSWAITCSYSDTSGGTCTINSVSASSVSYKFWTNYNVITTIPQAASSPPASSRWQSSAACSNTPTTGGNTYNCNSYQQWSNQYAYSVIPSGSPRHRCSPQTSTARQSKPLSRRL